MSTDTRPAPGGVGFGHENSRSTVERQPSHECAVLLLRNAAQHTGEGGDGTDWADERGTRGWSCGGKRNILEGRQGAWLRSFQVFTLHHPQLQGESRTPMAGEAGRRSHAPTLQALDSFVDGRAGICAA